ncbi:MAG: SCO1664 family protein [Actinobacteria bacterium]|uniref:Unannotated protein n=1 Tax=freshwater metagenome TaxID=449393 RepID=A0A6J6TF39_9ZZZZ|nr:SCO1664 family protein [Actinomycetota bacterium]
MTSSEEILRNGQLIVSGRLVDASNATLLADCKLGEESIKCIYKPIAGERPLWDFPDGNLASREFAAYLISEFMELHIVPMTMLRDGPFGSGMVQEWIEIDIEIDLANFFSQDDPQLRQMALFDAVINNTDRKIGHLLPRSDGKLFGCDHGVTFHKEDKLRTVLWQWADEIFSDKELEALNNLLYVLQSNPGEILKSLITVEEFSALRLRIENLLVSGKFPTPSADWPAIPWPAF